MLREEIEAQNPSPTPGQLAAAQAHQRLLDETAKNLGARDYKTAGSSAQSLIDQAVAEYERQNTAKEPPPAAPKTVDLGTPGAPAKPIDQLLREEIEGQRANPSARDLADEMVRSGTATPEMLKPPAEQESSAPVVDREAYAGGAREKRGDSASSLAGLLHEAQIDSTDIPNIEPDQWKALAARQSLDWPKTTLARRKLIRDTINEVMKLEGKTGSVSISDLMGGPK
jgi:hypothetical protein